MSNSLWPHGLQQTRVPCPSLSPGACSNSSPSSWWYHQTNLFSVPSFSSCFQSFSASESFPLSQLFIASAQRTGASASTLVLPMNIQVHWFPLEWTGWISLKSKWLSRVFSHATVQKHQFFSIQPSLWSNSHIHTWLLKKTIALTRWTFVYKVMSLLFNMLSFPDSSVGKESTCNSGDPS